MILAPLRQGSEVGVSGQAITRREENKAEFRAGNIALQLRRGQNGVAAEKAPHRHYRFARSDNDRRGVINPTGREQITLLAMIVLQETDQSLDGVGGQTGRRVLPGSGGDFRSG